jgi:hypothetical protein
MPERPPSRPGGPEAHNGTATDARISHHAPKAPRWWGWLAGLVALAASLGVFALYMQPEFLISLADRLWSCF